MLLMFDKFLSANARDFSQRYQGTYGFFRNKEEKPWLAKITAVEGTVTFINKAGVPFELAPDRPDDIGFQFIPPRSGYFNTTFGTIYVKRVAARQFQRGISDRNTQLFLLQEDWGFKQLPVNFQWLEAVYDSSITVATAYRKFLEGSLFSVAINNQFAIDKQVVRVYEHEVGSIEEIAPNMLKLNLKDKSLFRTEITDALRGITTVEFQ